MKRYIFIFILTIFVFITTYALSNGGEATIIVTKVALKYQGESDYRIYDISSMNFVFDPTSDTAEYGPTSIATLTDESNGLPSGVITEIKIYGTTYGPTVFYTNKWVGQQGNSYDTPDNAIDFLGSNIDLSTVKRKKVTVRFYGSPNGGDLGIATPAEENL